MDMPHADFTSEILLYPTKLSLALFALAIRQRRRMVRVLDAYDAVTVVDSVAVAVVVRPLLVICVHAHR